MSGCQADLTENIKQDLPYSVKQWHCLIDNINVFLDCGRRSNCGDYPEIEKPEAPTMWSAVQVHETLRQIQPSIMGDKPERWSRDWLNRVVQTLREGWPDCAGALGCDATQNLDFTGTAPYEPYLDCAYVEFGYHIYREWIGPWLERPVPFGDVVQQALFALADGPTANQSKWYKHTTGQIIDYSSMTEDDFVFTAEEEATDQPVIRFPASSQVVDEAILAARRSMAEEPTPEAYETLSRLAPYACEHAYIEIMPSYMPWRDYLEGALQPPNAFTIGDLVEYPLGTPLCAKPTKLSRVRVPTKFQFQPPGEDEPIIYTMAYTAQLLWALRLMWIEHLYEYALNPEVDTYYRYACTESTGLSTSYGSWVSDSGFVEYIGGQGYWLSRIVIQHSVPVSARAWMSNGKVIRYDTSRVPTTQIIYPVIPVIRWHEVATYLGRGDSAPCDDDWHY